MKPFGSCRLSSFFFAAGLLFIAPLARANGRYPAADQFTIDPVDSDHYVVRATFGLLQSTDRGATWSWVCEGAISSVPLVDPPIALTAGGTVLALAQSVSLSDRSGCRWTAVSDGFDDLAVTDLVTDPSLPSRIYAIEATRGDAGFAARIVESGDGGWHWSALGAPVDGIHPLTIDVAPSRPERMYMGGPDGAFQNGVVAVSDDRGSSWTLKPFPGLYVYISGVDPSNPDRLYARVDGSLRSQLYASEDAAMSWSLLFDSPIGLKGFAISPDGLHVAVGSAQDGVVVFTRSESDGGPSTFTMGPPRRIASRCLKWGRAGLFACADEAKDGFTLGLSPDGVEPFAPLLRLSALEPAKCVEGGAFGVCLSTWCDIKKTLPIDAMCAKGGGIVDASDDRKAGEADAAGGTDPDDGSGTSAVSSKGCACRARGTTGSTGWHAVVLAVVVLARRAGRIPTRNMSESQPGNDARRGTGSRSCATTSYRCSPPRGREF